MALREVARRVVPSSARKSLWRTQYKIRRTPETVRLWMQGYTDVRSIGTFAPELKDNLSEAIQMASDTLAAAHRTYVSTVSVPEMAGSLATMSLLKVLCERYNPRTILDVGSGFSTYVFSLYAGEAGGVTIRSIDDSPDWLRRTAGYLTDKGFPLPTFGGLDELRTLEEHGFDLIFHDLAFPTTRGVWLSTLFNARTPQGILVLDDLHFDAYRAEVAKVASAAGMKLLSLRPLTLDRIGRFSGLAINAPMGVGH